MSNLNSYINKATKLIEEAGLALNMALQKKGEARRELLELALIKYVHALPYLNSIPYIAKLIQKQIKIIEALLEAEIEECMKPITDQQ